MGERGEYSSPIQVQHDSPAPSVRGIGHPHATLPHPTHYPFLTSMEADKQVSLLYNYLSLGRFELGRAILTILHHNHHQHQHQHQHHQHSDPESSSSHVKSNHHHILSNLVLAYDFPCNWLTSQEIPSAAHMAWLCACEYEDSVVDQKKEGLPLVLLRSLEYCIVLHDALGDTGDDNMVVEAALNELALYQQQITSNTPKKVKLSEFALLQLSKIFTLFPLLGRVIFKYLEVPSLLQLPPHQQQQQQMQPQKNQQQSQQQQQQQQQQTTNSSKVHPTVWALHNLYIQIVYDMLGKHLYDEAYAYLQVLHPPTIPDEEDSQGHTGEILRSCQDLMKTIAGLCFKQRLREVSEPDIARSPNTTRRGSAHLFKFVPSDTSFMDLQKVFEGFLQSGHTAGLQTFCKEAASFVEESSHTANVAIPLPFTILEDNGAKEIEEDTLSKFWYWYYHYTSINNVHFLEHTTSRALALTSNLQISAANTMLTVFEKLRVLVYLMSWDNFNDQVMAKLKLSQILWENRNIGNANNTSSPLLTSKADRVTFQVKQAWWAVAHLYPDMALQDRLQPQQQSGNEVVQELLAKLKQHSLPFVVRESLPTILPEEIVDIVQENPDTSPNASLLKDQDSDILCGYYVVKRIVSLFHATGEAKALGQPELAPVLRFTAQLLRNIKSLATKLSLLEVLYLTIFMDTSHLRNGSNTTFEPSRTEELRQNDELETILSHSSGHISSTSTRYLFPPALIGGLLEMIDSCLQDISATGDSNTNPQAQDIGKRMDTLSKLVHEARARFEIVTAIARSSTDRHTFMAQMTAAPSTLLTSCMRAGGLISQIEQIIQFFSLNDHPLSQEARLAQRLADFETMVQTNPSGNILSAIDTLLSTLPPDAAFTTRTDFAVTTASPTVSAALLAKLEASSTSSSSTTTSDFINLISCLAKHFPSSSIRNILSNIKLLNDLHKNRGTVLLESHLTFQKLAASNLELLINLVNDSVSQNKTTGTTSEATSVMANMLKIVSGLPGAQYLHNFLEHVLALGKALERPEEYFSIVAQGPKQIVQELIFKNNLYSKAEELSSILKLDLVGIIFSGLFQNNTVHHVLQPELIRYLGVNLPALATLVCSLRCPDPSSATSTSIYTNAASDLTKDYPALHTWVQMQAEAKQLFWKTCQPAVSGTDGLDSGEAFGLDSLPAEEKAIYKLVSNVEDIPDSFYSKIVDRLIASHALLQAVEVADKYLPVGAADWVLRVMAESCDDPTDSWHYVRRIKDKVIATAMVLKWYTSWTLDVCLDMLFMCKCHLSQQKPTEQSSASKVLPKASVGTANSGDGSTSTLASHSLQTSKLQSDPQLQSQYRETVEHLYSQMLIFKSILTVDTSWNDKWQSIDDLAKRDPVLLIRRLLGIKQYVLARKIRELFVVPNIKSEIDESYLLHLLEQNDTSTALQTLMELGEDAIKIVESLSNKIHENYSTKLFLVQFLMGNMSSALSTASYQALSTRETGIKVLLKLPKELQQQYAKLTDYPSLIIESLIMNEMAPQVHRLLSEIPNLRDDDMILKYASKALDFRPIKKERRETTNAATPTTPTSAPTSAPTTPSSSTTNIQIAPSTPTNTQAQAQSRSLSQPIAISTPSDTSSLPDATPTSTSYIPTGTSVTSSSYMNAPSSYIVTSTPMPPQGLLRPASTTSPTTPSSSSRRTRRAKWHLLAPPADSPVRAAHYFPAAPSISLAKALFDLVGDRRRAGQACLSVCTSLAQKLSAVYSDDNLLIISLIRQLLLYAKLQFMQDPRGGGSDGVATCDTFLGKVELFQELVIAKCTFNTSLEDLSDPQKARHLRDKLISSDRLKFAIDVATKCNILPDPAWLAWGLSLLALGKYGEAREKFKYCLASATERRAASSTVTHPHSDMVDPASVLVKIMNVLESQPAPQPAYLRYICDKLMGDPQNTKGGAYYDEMSVDAFLAAMHVGASKMGGTPTKSPATTPTKPEKPFPSLSPSPSPPSSASSSSSYIPPQKASIDNDRYEEAVYYIRKYGTARGLINFQMRHGRLGEAITTLVSDNIPPNIFHEEMFLPSLAQGTIETLFDVAKKTNTSLAKLNPHLTHTCKMLFQARHYHLLQIVQVFMGDPVRAGLTSIKMYMEYPDAADFEGKLRILEDARRFFQEGLSTKSLVVQGTGAALPDAEISKYAQTTSLQIEVSAFLHSQGKLVPAGAYKLSLFGPPSQKSEIAELLLVLYNFALAFKIMQDFRLPITTIYLNAICTMSRKKQAAKVNDLLKEIKGTCSDNDWDEIVLASIKVHVSELQDAKTAEKIASKLVGSRSKVIANILCGKRKAAYLQAVRDNDRALVQMVCKEAEKANDATIFGLCEKYLSQNP